MTLKTKTIYQGKVITLVEEQVRLPNNVDCNLEIVRHPGGAAVVAVNEQGEICLLKQYRHAANGWLWELPAGKLEVGEQARVTAMRELKEESGVVAKCWQSLGQILTSPGVMTEVIYLFLATQLDYAEQSAEEDECIEIHWVALNEAQDWIMQGKITDAKTIIGLYKVRYFLP